MVAAGILFARPDRGGDVIGAPFVHPHNMCFAVNPKGGLVHEPDIEFAKLDFKHPGFGLVWFLHNRTVPPHNWSAVENLGMKIAGAGPLRACPCMFFTFPLCRDGCCRYLLA